MADKDNPIIEVTSSYFRNVERRGSEACWPWRAARTDRGYGVTHIVIDGRRRAAAAHRVAHYIATGVWEPWSKGRLVRHLCHNPACCNPGHLTGGNRLDNADDRLHRVMGWPLRHPSGALVRPVPVGGAL